VRQPVSVRDLRNLEAGVAEIAKVHEIPFGDVVTNDIYPLPGFRC
jgi:hypothetical protein